MGFTHASLPNLPELSRADLVRIFATHLALRPDTAAALDAAERALRELPASQSMTRVELHGEVRGRVSWTLTQRRRIAEADPALFVCTPPERRYDTPLGRLVLVALHCAAQLADLSGLPKKGIVGERVHDISRRARRLMLHPKLSKVRRVGPDALRHTEGLVARRPFLAPLVAFAEDFVLGIRNGSAESLEQLLERQFLSPDRDSVLFELQVGFDMLDALRQIGYQVQGPATLLPAAGVPFATLHGPAGQAALWWQRPTWTLAPDKAATSIWAEILASNGLSRVPLRPDFLLDIPGANRRLLVEVKLTTSEEGSPERDGLRDVLAYLTDAAGVFQDCPHPHALVAAWNASGRPVDRQNRIQISDQHRVVPTLVEALQGAQPR
ncbi:hypothetical protein ACI784_09240 [Geodermatophilus sp. SYSU D01186]